ncbi:50S ribosomal protein L25 [Candidatus Uhrbacteria bacterium]|nr:50S ribosomal protein L25 [Candidatus Uhrbacteria bacterium]
METISLSAQVREIKGKSVRRLREEGAVPAVIYGHGIGNSHVSVDRRVFEKVLEQAGESTLIDLSVDGGKSVKVLIQEVQREPLKGGITHVDFRQVNMTERLETDVEIRLVGEAPAVKILGGMIITSMDRVTVRCLPADLVSEIEVDVSVLNEYGDMIKVGDLTPPPGIEFVTGGEETIVVASEPSDSSADTATEVKATDVPVVESKAKAEKEK